MLILAIDQGTTNTKALVFDATGKIVAQASAACTTDYPRPGWAEQSAEEIRDTTRAVIDVACKGIEDRIAAIGISNQRETLVVWDAETGSPVGPAPLWQCRRTADACATLIEAGHAKDVAALTGLGINPLFPASKLAWILQNRPEAADLARAGRLRAGTVDSWLLWTLTSGSVHATDHSNASRTLLFDIGALEWSSQLAEIFGVPISCLPSALPSDSRFGVTAAGASALPVGVPILAMMGDSHAALYGHGIRTAGIVKVTYGTGSSLMTLTDSAPASSNGLSGTIAWTTQDGTAYALEGNITVSAQAAAFMAQLVGAADASVLSELAQSVPDSGGVCFVPALAGLGAPHWHDAARGTITGLTHASKPTHLARAAFEAIAHQVADVFEAMEQDLGHPLGAIRADGGASRNDFLMQIQTDLLGRPLNRSAIPEIGAFGVASLAAQSIGAPFNTSSAHPESFQSRVSEQDRFVARRYWHDAIARTRFRPDE